MSSGRISVLIVSFVVVALMLVHLRREQTRCAAGLLSAEAEWVRLRRERWALQTRAARLRTPQGIHDRVGSLRAELIPPGDEMGKRSTVRLASDQPQG